MLGVRSLQAACDFYVGVLEFGVDWVSDGDAKVAGISRGNKGMMLSEHEPSGVTLWVGCDDIVPIYELLSQSGAESVQQPTNQPWAYEFRAKDPDGNVLWFGSGPIDV